MKTTSLGLLIVLLAPAVMAADITVLGGYQVNPDFEISTATVGAAGDGTSEDLGLDNGPTLSLAWDFMFQNNPNQRIGLYLSHQQADFDSGQFVSDTGLNVTHLHFTGTSYYPNGNWEPFVSAGIGAGIFSPDDSELSSETQLSAHIAAGTNYKFTENLLLRLDVRWVPTFFNGSGAIFCSGGCVIKAESDIYSQVQTNIGLMYRY